ncbi:hypothetical protein N9L06_01725 [Mariniblastus sp.]|nr:hypothetical protein [Mariniblastus sp.]
MQLQSKPLNRSLTSLFALVLVALCSTSVHADIIVSGTGNLTIGTPTPGSLIVVNTFLPNQNFMVTFSPDEPATDQLDENFQNTQGLFNGTATLTVEDSLTMATVVAGLESTNVNALRQDGGQQRIFFVNDGNAFNQSISAGFSGTEVFDDPNVFGPFPTTPQAANFGGGGLPFILSDGRQVQFNSVDNSTFTVVASAIPEPTATAILIAGMFLLEGRRRK